MKLYVDMEEITSLFRHAQTENRNFLFEYEVYELIRHMGGETPPAYYVLPREERVDPRRLATIPGDRVVIKILSPHIIHKSDVGGIHITEKSQEAVLSAMRTMQYAVPEKFAEYVENLPASARPGPYRHLKGPTLVQAIAQDIKGVLICQYLPVKTQGIGNELLVGLRNSREFGMILTAGLGGTDTELYAGRFRPDQAVVSAATAMIDGEAFFDLYRHTISWDKLSGRARGEQRKVTDEQLRECFAAMVEVGNHFSALNPQAPFIIDALEINPFAFHRYLMVPLDGFCRFSLPRAAPALPPRSPQGIEALLHPQTLGIIGVSARSRNPGRIMLQNILANGFNRQNLYIIHPHIAPIEGIVPLPSLDRLPGPLDLLILAIGADKVLPVMETVLDTGCARSVILIPGGLGEVAGSEALGARLETLIRTARRRRGKTMPVILGGNSLGVLSHPGRYDSLFIPEEKLPKSRGDQVRSSAFLSQSGAYMITRMSKLSFFDPAYALSIGNQMDLTAGDLMGYFNTRDEITTIAVYMEGFKDLDGLAFARGVTEGVKRKKEVLFYKAGRTEAGKSATSGHTASLAGDYTVCRACMAQAGAMVAHTFTEFEGLVRLSVCLSKKEVHGSRLAAVSNAGYEAVGIADNIMGDDFSLELAEFSPDTVKVLTRCLDTHGLSGLVNVRNPLDVTPMAVASVYETVIQALLSDPGVDMVAAALVPLTPVIKTLPEHTRLHNDFSSKKGIVQRISRIAGKSTKPLIMVVDSGALYDPLARALQRAGLPVFRSADRAVHVLGRYIHQRQRISRKFTDRSSPAPLQSPDRI